MLVRFLSAVHAHPTSLGGIHAHGRALDDRLGPITGANQKLKLRSGGLLQTCVPDPNRLFKSSSVFRDLYPSSFNNDQAVTPTETLSK